MVRPNSRMALLLFCMTLSVLCGCAGVERRGLEASPLLYADPDTRVERPAGRPVRFTSGMELQAGDVVETRNGFAFLDFGDGMDVTLNRNTRIELGSIRLLFGEIFSRLRKITRQGGGEVVTDELAASAQGTEFAMFRFTLPEWSLMATDVLVRRGRVLCAPGRVGAWTPIMLTANQTLRSDASGQRQDVMAVDATALTRWADEEAERLLVPRQPPEKTGGSPPDISPVLQLLYNLFEQATESGQQQPAPPNQGDSVPTPTDQTTPKNPPGIIQIDPNKTGTISPELITKPPPLE